MKAILEFNLPEDTVEYHRHLLSEDMAVVLTEVFEIARSQLKHGDEAYDRKTLEKIKETLSDTFWKIMD